MFVFRHFALVMIAVVVFNALLAWRRAPNFATARGSAPADAKRFIARAAGVLILLFAALEVMTVVTGAGAPFCFIPTLRPYGILDYLGWAMWVGCTVGVGLWIVAGSGAQAIARYGPLFARTYRPNLEYRPRTVRLIGLLWCLGTLAVPVIMSVAVPPQLACPVPSQASSATPSDSVRVHKIPVARVGLGAGSAFAGRLVT